MLIEHDTNCNFFLSNYFRYSYLYCPQEFFIKMKKENFERKKMEEKNTKREIYSVNMKMCVEL